MALFRSRPSRKAQLEQAEDRLNALERNIEEKTREASLAISAVFKSADRLEQYRQVLLKESDTDATS